MSSTVPIRLAVFDCDGTLVDSQLGIIAAMSASWRSLGLTPPSAEAIRRQVGLPLVEAAAALAPDHDGETHAALAQGYRDSYRTQRAHAMPEEPLYPGAREALDSLETAGFLLGIATGKGRTGLDMVLEQHDLAGRFVTLQTSDLGPGKPRPEMLYRAMHDAGVEREHTVMIGDTAFDMVMARNAGVAAIGVSWGYHPIDELRDAGADAIIDVYDKLPGVVGTLLSKDT